MEQLKDNMLKTSWSNEQLEKLCEPKNHRIRFDGFDYVWEHRIDGNKWELHSVFLKPDYKTLYGNMKFWLYQWSRELTDRKINAAEDYLKSMQQYLKATQKAVEIKNSSMTTKDKIVEVKKVLPEISFKELADILDVSRQIIHRYIKHGDTKK